MTRLVLFEDNNKLRQSLCTLLNGVEDYEVCGDYENCQNASEVVLALQPDVVIMDIDMPGVGGLEGLRKIKEVRPETLIIMHTVFEDNEKLFLSLCYGANGYLLKNSPLIKLLEAIEDVRNGGAPMSPGVAKKVLQSFHKPAPANEYNLTPREKEVLEYLVKGYSYKMIAESCLISPNTVRVHIKNIYNKLHVNCGREAVAKALKDRIV